MMKFTHIVGLGSAIISDTVVELFGGFIPIIGDVADVVQIGIHIYCFGFHLPAAVGAVEFVPIVGDILPMHTASAVWAIRQEN